MTNYLPKKNSQIFILSLVSIILINHNPILAALHQNYFVFEHDAYMHMVLALAFFKNHQWYAGINPSINAPYGADTHAWTQVTMLFLISGTYFLKFFFPLKKALYIWCFILPMLFNLLSVLLLLWSVKPLKTSNSQNFFLVAAFLLNPFLYFVYQPLRVDYDFLLVSTSIVYWGCLLRLISTDTKYWACMTAVAAAFGIWISISFTVLVFVGLAVFFWLALVRNQLGVERVSFFFVVLCSALALIIPLEYRNFFTISYDVVSIVYLTFYLLVFLCFIIYSRYLKATKNIMNLMSLLSLALLLFMVMNHFFPGFYKGPYNAVTPFVLKNFFPNNLEFYSPFYIDNCFAMALLFYFFLGAGYFYYLHLNRELTTLQVIVLFAASITSLLTAYMNRWGRIATPINIVLVSFFVFHFSNTRINQFIKWLIIVLIILLPSLLFFSSRGLISEAEEQCQKQFYTMIEDKFLEQPQFIKDKILFISSNYGPFILYFTHFAVVATNDHHNPSGLEDSFKFFTEDEEDAKSMVRRRGIDLILLCDNGYKPSFNLDKSTWLEGINLPATYSKWHLYRASIGQSNSRE